MWPGGSPWVWWAFGAAVLIVGLGGPYLVGWFSRQLGLTHGLSDFDKAISLLNDPSHFVRERAAGDLEELAKLRPSKFHVRAMKAFASFLAYPPSYGSGHEQAGQIDPYSPDTLAIMRAIVSRTDGQLKAERDVNYKFSSNRNSPFEYRDGGFWFRGERLVG